MADEARHSLRPARISLINTIFEVDKFSGERSGKAVNDWIQKADLQPVSGESPNQVALDETVIHADDAQFWLYPVVDHKTNQNLHIRLYTSQKRY